MRFCKKLADTNVGLEVNTGGYHYGLGETKPMYGYHPAL